MTERLRWGILGTGWIADWMTKDLRVLGSPVTAVGSRTQQRADAYAAEHGIPNAHGSYAALVADPEVDVVYIATPHPSHVADAMLALNAGKHVLVEKPFTLNAAEARALTALASERGLVVLEAMWTRWLPHMARIREIIAAGTLGEVRTVIADHTQKLSADPAHRMQSLELGGGALLDLGIYPVSFAWELFGAPSTIAAVSSPTPSGADRQTAMTFTYADGQQAVMQCALDTQGPNQAVILGTDARIEIDPVWYTPTTFRVIAPDGSVIEEFDGRLPAGRGMQFQAAALEALVAAGKLEDELLPPSESVAIMESLDEVRRQIGLRYPGDPTE
ncbi:MAG: Gfo/Idh/MocA family oxidoreductase [Pseudolysinimonas sp.]